MKPANAVSVGGAAVDQAAKAGKDDGRQAAGNHRQHVAQRCHAIAPAQTEKRRLQDAKADQGEERPARLLGMQHPDKQDEQKQGDDEGKRNENHGAVSKSNRVH
ncbi:MULTISPECIES: hypothetical protein [unclassified Mesorhizobium]|uniref:hypothetical protein n=1 Tax=unclassified Mesorhizobium TaxID=325217 RepID=UPI001FE025F8|nr:MULTISPECIES: hypothetical protein [unclassified Mesorhizobium]